MTELPPGTRIPTVDMSWAPATKGDIPQNSYYRGLVEGLVLGGTVGTIMGVMCAALAWSHLGG